MKNTFIQKFEIIGLFGYKDVSITFNHSTLIVIGENGFGKTSILNALKIPEKINQAQKETHLQALD